MQAAHHPDCSGHVYTGPGEGATQAQCSSSLRWWILAFTLVQLGLSQLKDFHSIWCAPCLSRLPAAIASAGSWR